MTDFEPMDPAMQKPSCLKVYPQAYLFRESIHSFNTSSSLWEGDASARFQVGFQPLDRGVPIEMRYRLTPFSDSVIVRSSPIARPEGRPETTDQLFPSPGQETACHTQVRTRRHLGLRTVYHEIPFESLHSSHLCTKKTEIHSLKYLSTQASMIIYDL